MAPAGHPVEAFEYFRVQRRPPRRALLGVSLIVVAGCAVGAVLAHHLDASLAPVAAVSGGLTLFGGMLLGFGALVATLLDHAHLGAREDGLVLHDERGQTMFAWSELARVERREDAVVVAQKDGGERVFYVGEAAADIAGRLEILRRRADLGIRGARLRA